MTVCTMYSVTLTPNNNGEERIKHTQRQRERERENKRVCERERLLYKLKSTETYRLLSLIMFGMRLFIV